MGLNRVGKGDRNHRMLNYLLKKRKGICMKPHRDQSRHPVHCVLDDSTASPRSRAACCG